MTPKAGKTYTAYGQGTTSTPQTAHAYLLWINGDTVHYRLIGRGTVKQMPVAKFIEMITPPNQNGTPDAAEKAAS